MADLLITIAVALAAAILGGALAVVAVWLLHALVT